VLDGAGRSVTVPTGGWPSHHGTGLSYVAGGYALYFYSSVLLWSV
jgi:hypothetical protein